MLVVWLLLGAALLVTVYIILQIRFDCNATYNVHTKEYEWEKKDSK